MKIIDRRRFLGSLAVGTVALRKKCTLASSSPTVWCHCRYSHLGRAASPIRQDMIFGKDSQKQTP
jgi:hypothetical protein